MKKWIKRFYASLLVFTVLILVGIHLGMKVLRFTDVEAQEYFEEKGFKGEIKNISINRRSIKIVTEELQQNDSILMVFVHGAPGTWDAFKTYMTDEDLQSRTRMIAYDRPGYGGSGAEAMPGIREQSEILKEILKLYGLQRNILIGHSYGGPIIGQVALDEDSQTDIAIMIAPLIDPESEPLFWYSYFSYWKLTSWLLPTELVVAGSEKFAHARELELIQDQWQNAGSLFIHVHGLEDGLAPARENLEFSRKHIPEQYLETIVYKDKGHLVIWTDYGLMKGVILDAITTF